MQTTAFTYSSRKRGLTMGWSDPSISTDTSNNEENKLIYVYICINKNIILKFYSIYNFYPIFLCWVFIIKKKLMPGFQKILFIVEREKSSLYNLNKLPEILIRIIQNELYNFDGHVW